MENVKSVVEIQSDNEARYNAEICCVLQIYMNGGIAKLRAGEGSPRGEFIPGEKPQLIIPTGWYDSASHEEVMTLLQRILTDIKGDTNNG